MTRKNSSWPTFTQVAHAALLVGARGIGLTQAAGSRALSLGGDTTRDLAAGLMPLGNLAQARLDRALESVDTDLFTDRMGDGRRLKSAPGVPGVIAASQATAVAAPPPPSPPAAGSAPVAVLIPDAANYGACDSNVNTTLARVKLAHDQGANLIVYDTYAGNLSQSFANSPARLADAMKVVAYAGQLGLPMVFGISKDDASMFTPGRPELDRVPTQATAQALLAVATSLRSYPDVALLVGGQPKNANGSLTGEIANTYGTIFNALRAANFTNNILFKAPAHYGQNLSYYASGNASYYQAQNIRFAIDLASNNDTAAVDATIAQCNPLPCVIITGEQVSARLGLYNTLDEVARQLGVAAARGVPTVVTPFGDLAIQSDEGESVGLAGNVCKNATALPTLSSYGSAVLAAQRAALSEVPQAG